MSKCERRREVRLSRKWDFTKESTEEGAKHRVREGGEEGAELADHAQRQHQGRAVLDHPATADLRNTPEARRHSALVLHPFSASAPHPGGKCDRSPRQRLESSYNF